MVTRHSLEKLAGTVQVDLDGLWVLRKHYAVNEGRSLTHDTVFFSGLERILEIFERAAVKATLFVVGKDLEVPSKRNLLREAVRRGHEIANHSLRHLPGFSYLSAREKREEITSAHKAIEDALGVSPAGFRAPDFDVDVETFRILSEEGYKYDSSLIPCFLNPIFRIVYRALRKGERCDAVYLGKLRRGMLKITPYYIPCISPTLLEVPVSLMPFFRLPFHASFSLALHKFALGVPLFQTGLALCRITRTPLNFLFHLADICDPPEGPVQAKHLGIEKGAGTKKDFCFSMLSTILNFYTMLRTDQFVDYLIGRAQRRGHSSSL